MKTLATLAKPCLAKTRLRKTVEKIKKKKKERMLFI